MARHVLQDIYYKLLDHYLENENPALKKILQDFKKELGYIQTLDGASDTGEPGSNHPEDPTGKP